MTQKIAVTIIHGIGEQDGNYASKTCAIINRKFTNEIYELIDDPSSQLIIEPICWTKVFSKRECDLYESTLKDHLRYHDLRRFVIQYFGDAIAYQRVETAKGNYIEVHNEVSKALTILSKKAGDQAPLCVIAHSLGSTIASNYFYDLEFKSNYDALKSKKSSPIEKGETLTLFYTLGSTLPLWSLRYGEEEFNRTINIPSKNIKNFYPNLKGEWINFYDKDDILGYPLKGVSKGYKQAVNEDKEVSVGGLVEGWNPLCHTKYLTDEKVIGRIVDGLVRTWKHVNHS